MILIIFFDCLILNMVVFCVIIGISFLFLIDVCFCYWCMVFIGFSLLVCRVGMNLEIILIIIDIILFRMMFFRLIYIGKLMVLVRIWVII